MNIRRIIKVLKKAGEYFSVAAGVVSVAFAIVAAFATMPIWVGLVVAGGVGLLFACLGGGSADRDIKERECKIERDQEERRKALAEMHEMNLALKKLKGNIHYESQQPISQQSQVISAERALNSMSLFASQHAVEHQDKEFNQMAELRIAIK